MRGEIAGQFKGDTLCTAGNEDDIVRRQQWLAGEFSRQTREGRHRGATAGFIVRDGNSSERPEFRRHRLSPLLGRPLTWQCCPLNFNIRVFEKQGLQEASARIYIAGQVYVPGERANNHATQWGSTRTAGGDC